MREIYRENDFVNYVGNSNSYSEVIVAQVDSIVKTENYWRFDITVIEPCEKVSCLGDLVRPILTTKQHLENLDFVKDPNENGGVLYALGTLQISKSLFFVSKLNLSFNTGFRIGDLRKLSVAEFVEKYVSDLEIDFDKLEYDFPSVMNINELIFEYSKYYEFDIKRICC